MFCDFHGGKCPLGSQSEMLMRKAVSSGQEREVQENIDRSRVGGLGEGGQLYIGHIAARRK